jgi:uncharacterized protein (DUF924 family)
MFIAVAAAAAHGSSRAHGPKPVAPEAEAIVQFWRDAGPKLWFAKDAAFDRRFRERFMALYERAARGELDGWLGAAHGALALCLLLDQFPRNAFRGTPRMYATDARARAAADAAVEAGYDRELGELALFVYLPFGHSEDLVDQDRAVELCKRLGGLHTEHAEGHRAIVQRFGRFPHRNPILGRRMLPEEQRFLDQGGFRG